MVHRFAVVALDRVAAVCGSDPHPPPYGSETTDGNGDLAFKLMRRPGAFPYRRSPDGLLGDGGDFVVEMRLKYDSLTSHGAGFRGRPWADATPIGSNSPLAHGAERCGAFGVWGDSSGLRTSLMGITAPIGNGSLAFHTYRFEYVNGKYLVFVDNALRIGPISSVMRADRLWLGNPIFTYWAAADWSYFTLDDVRVSQPAFIDGDVDGEYDETPRRHAGPAFRPRPPATPMPTASPTTAIRTADCRPSRARSTSSSRPIPTGPRRSSASAGPLNCSIGDDRDPDRDRCPWQPHRHRGCHDRLGPVGHLL